MRKAHINFEKAQKPQIRCIFKLTLKDIEKVFELFFDYTWKWGTKTEFK